MPAIESRAHPELAAALGRMLDRIDQELQEGGYDGEPIIMYLAGGMAVNHYCGTRYTEDVDASFSRRLRLEFSKLTIDYVRTDGTPSFIYFDQNYNPTLALLHEDFEGDAIEWKGIGNERRRIHLRLLSPVDLACSKIGRFSDQDQLDIRALARAGLFTVEQLRSRADAALGYFVGNTRFTRTSIELICRQVERDAASAPDAGSGISPSPARNP